MISWQDILNKPKTYSKNHIEVHYPDIYREIIKCYGETFSEQLYNYYHPQCNHYCECGKKLSFRGKTKGYGRFCSSKCAMNSQEVLNKYHATNLKRYGGLTPFHNQSIQNKVKQTNIKKYGVENQFQRNEIKERLKQTNLNNLGVEYPTQSQQVKDKVKRTYLKRYGGYTLQSDILKEKVKQTNLERYGVEYSSQNKQIREKQIETQRENNIFNKNYLIGYTDIGEWICKCPHPNTCNQCFEKFYITNPDIYNSRIKYRNELCTKLFPIGSKGGSGVSNNSQIYFDQLNEYFPDSIYYKKSGYEYKVGKYNLDFYIPSLQIDIEFNGIYWHGKPSLYKADDILNFHGIQKKAKYIWNYDKIRKEYIEQQGIKVIVVWEDELPDPKDILRSLSEEI